MSKHDLPLYIQIFFSLDVNPIDEAGISILAICQ